MQLKGYASVTGVEKIVLVTVEKETCNVKILTGNIKIEHDMLKRASVGFVRQNLSKYLGLRDDEIFSEIEAGTILRFSGVEMNKSTK